MLDQYTGLTLQQLDIFLTAAKYENFSYAAEELHMTVPTVSRNIAAMESALGVILFVRHRQRVRLTSAGKELYGELRPLSESFKSAINHAREVQALQNNKLHIMDLAIVEPDYYLFPILEQLEREYPQLDISIEHVTEKEQVEGLISRKCDLAFVFTMRKQELEDAGIIVKPFLVSKAGLVIAARHPLFHKPDLTWEELKDDIIITGNTGEYEIYCQHVKEAFAKFGFSIKKQRSVGTSKSMDTELHRGKCVALLNTIYANKDRPDLRYIELPGFDVDFGISIAYHSENSNPYIPKLLACASKLSAAILRAHQ